MSASKRKSEALTQSKKDQRLLPTSVLANIFASQILVMRDDGMTWLEVALYLAGTLGRPVSAHGLKKYWKPPVGVSPFAKPRKKRSSKISVATARFMFPSLESARLAGNSWEEIAKECHTAGLCGLSVESVKSLWKRGAP